RGCHLHLEQDCVRIRSLGFRGDRGFRLLFADKIAGARGVGGRALLRLDHLVGRRYVECRHHVHHIHPRWRLGGWIPHRTQFNPAAAGSAGISKLAIFCTDPRQARKPMREYKSRAGMVDQSLSLSIVIANYNYAEYVGLAIESALAVDWPDVEVVVVD